MMVSMVYNGILDRMRKMASIIDQEPNGPRKEKMLEQYELADKELETWQKVRTITDTLSQSVK